MTTFYSFTLIVAITIVIRGEFSDGYRILGVFPLNGKSHFTMLEMLMKSLAKKGHQVDVINHFPLKKPFPNYKDYSLYGLLPDLVNNVSYDLMQTFTSSSMKQFVHNAGDKICNLLSHPSIKNIIKNPPNDPPYDLVIVEVFAAHCYFGFGRHLKVPVIGVSTTDLNDWVHDLFGNPANLATVPGLFSGFSSKMNFWERTINVLLHNFVKYQFNYHVSKQKQFVNEHFGPGYPSINELSTEMALLFTNAHFSLNGIKSLTPAIVEVGGLHIDDSGEEMIPELQKWLDESKQGCIYVSFGSMVTIESFPKEFLETLYSSFKKIAPVRVLMKITKTVKLPPGLPENVKTHPFLPQIQVLKHQNVKVFVTHGGLMGTLESMYCGVPMVGIPLFGDQIINIKTYVEKKMAVSLNYRNITEKALTDAVNKILKTPDFKINVEKMSKLYFDRPMSPQDTAVFWVEYIIRHGNVLRSPAIDLAWWQVQLLDVYGFLLLGTLLILYIVFLIIKTVFKFLCKSRKAEKEAFHSKKSQ